MEHMSIMSHMGNATQQNLGKTTAKLNGFHRAAQGHSSARLHREQRTARRLGPVGHSGDPKIRGRPGEWLGTMVPNIFTDKIYQDR